MYRFIARVCFVWMPGRSTNAICIPGLFSTPWMRVRVVCGFGLTMLTFCPISAFSSVDLPTFGRPASAAKPQRTVGSALGGRNRSIRRS